ncbi:hypothetical protein VHEMI00650 [[Torrubiella] hemipterigena]|uniref:Uncharacterized protein n=1 Tax=[Torrubiella] hemipterigena TaxID=1531966 RepID=A0A0A1T551_9HYPO|nr:hypothetical protein VHEMI00650 [[Torrubiella] hemipterigena]
MQLPLAAALLAAYTVLATPATTSDLPALQDAAISIQGSRRVQFDVNAWIENVVVQPNGNLILTQLSPNATVYEVVKPWEPKPTLRTLFTIPGISGVTGIASISYNRYVFFGGNFSFEGAQAGSWSAYTLDMNPPQPRYKKITAMPEAVFLNGASKVPYYDDLVLVGDSKLGQVFRLNATSGTYDVPQKYDVMNHDSVEPLSLGINGVRLHGNYLYWTNWDKHSYYKLEVSCDGTTAPGATPILIGKKSETVLDDFDFYNNTDTAFVATNYGDSILRITADGTQDIVAGGANDTLLNTVSACKFGKSASDKRVLYAVTAGAHSPTPNDPNQTGARVIAYDLAPLIR